MAEATKEDFKECIGGKVTMKKGKLTEAEIKREKKTDEIFHLLHKAVSFINEGRAERDKIKVLDIELGRAASILFSEDIDSFLKVVEA